MTRRIVYGISLWVFIGAVACTIASVVLPNWVAYNSPSDYDPIHVSYGLYKRCSDASGKYKCSPFPTAEDCSGSKNEAFCSLWRSSGFFMNFALIIELATVVAYIAVLAGGRNAREVGWKIVAPLLGIVSVSQLLAMALVAYSFDHDEQFIIGWELDKAWILCTVSWTVLLLNATGLLAAAYTLPYEDDYEPIS